MLPIVGLGNPGTRYAATRHNVGFMVLERLARDAGCSIERRRFNALVGQGRLCGRKVLLAQPQTYMNLSGRSVGEIVRFFKADPADLIVVHDETDLPFGSLKLKFGGGYAGHKGLESIATALGTSEFRRVRVGIGRAPPPMATSDHVLAPFASEEREWLDELLETAAEATSYLLQQGISDAMNRFNGVHVGAEPSSET